MKKKCYQLFVILVLLEKLNSASYDDNPYAISNMNNEMQMLHFTEQIPDIESFDHENFYEKYKDSAKDAVDDFLSPKIIGFETKISNENYNSMIKNAKSKYMEQKPRFLSDYVDIIFNKAYSKYGPCFINKKNIVDSLQLKSQNETVHLDEALKKIAFANRDKGIMMAKLANLVKSQTTEKNQLSIIEEFTKAMDTKNFFDFEKYKPWK